MDRHLVEYQTEEGKSIFVEVVTPDSDSQRISTAKGIEKAATTFEQSLSNIEPATHAVLQMLNKMGVDEGQIEVGLKFSAKAGVVLASADSEATFKITMKWKSK